jgi:hypothetical protein
LYGWLYVENIEPTRPQRALELGAAVHAALTTAHSDGQDEQGPYPACSERAFAAGIRVAERVMRERMATAPGLPTDEAELRQMLDTLRTLLPMYRAHYGSEQLWRPLGQEVDFDVEVGEGTGVRLVGRLDTLVTFQNQLWIVDYKTMSRLDPRDFLRYETDIQLTAYIYAGTKQLSLDAGRPVVIRGAIIDGLVKTAVPQFHRELFTRSMDDLRAFEIEFCARAWEMAAKHAAVAGDRQLFNAYMSRVYDTIRHHGWKAGFTRNTQHCFRYSTCAFLDLCTADTPTRRAAFRPRRPSPRERAR